MSGEISFINLYRVYHSPVQLQHFLKYNPKDACVRMECFYEFTCLCDRYDLNAKKNLIGKFLYGSISMES